ncbi:MAG: branched-chain amino acid ABC transporter permease [Halanaeroarchaeum sp.]
MFDDVSPFSLVAVAMALVVGIVFPFVAPNAYILHTGMLVLMWMGFASAWNIIGGFTGYVSFGHAAFIGYGMFTAGILYNVYGIGGALETFGAIGGFVGILIAAGLVSGVIAAILSYPLLRLRGHYFAIAMLGVAEASKAFFTNYPADLLPGDLRGARGWMLPIIDPPMVTAEAFLYYAMFVVATLTVLMAYLIKRSKIGYGLIAIREGENAARMLGVPVTRYKIYGFILSAFPVGILGAINAYSIHTVKSTQHHTFHVANTIDMIVVAMLGGLGTVTGPIVGSVVFIGLRDFIFSDYLQFHLLLTGLLIVLVVLGAPRGLVGLYTDYRETGKILGIDVRELLGLTTNRDTQEDEQ